MPKNGIAYGCERIIRGANRISRWLYLDMSKEEIKQIEAWLEDIAKEAKALKKIAEVEPRHIAPNGLPPRRKRSTK